MVWRSHRRHRIGFLVQTSSKDPSSHMVRGMHQRKGVRAYSTDSSHSVIRRRRRLLRLWPMGWRRRAWDWHWSHSLARPAVLRVWGPPPLKASGKPLCGLGAFAWRVQGPEWQLPGPCLLRNRTSLLSGLMAETFAVQSIFRAPAL